jgi:hypothetical protein
MRRVIALVTFAIRVATAAPFALGCGTSSSGAAPDQDATTSDSGMTDGSSEAGAEDAASDATSDAASDAGVESDARLPDGGCGLSVFDSPVCQAWLDNKCCATERACAADAGCAQAMACIKACPQPSTNECLDACVTQVDPIKDDTIGLCVKLPPRPPADAGCSWP